jgi:hypothetical protein
MKEDAELVYIKYEKKLHELEGLEKQVDDKLNTRLTELDTEAKNIKAVMFDAKLQFRSNEMKEETYQQIKIQTDELIEHINNERAEIENIRRKLAAQTLENISTTGPSETASLKEKDDDEEEEKASSQHTVNQPTEEVSVVQVSAASPEEKDTTPSSEESRERTETNWLNQVITK